MDLVGKLAVVIGGAKGIGRGICHALGDQGASVIIADIDRESAEDVAESLWKRGRKAEAMTCDATDPACVEAISERVITEFTGVDLLCNCADIGGEALDTLIDGERGQAVGSRLKAIHYATQAFVPKMLERSTQGWILNTASEHEISQTCLSPTAASNASNDALVSLSDVMRREYAKKEIGVSVLCPGPAVAEIHSDALGQQKWFIPGAALPAVDDETFFSEDVDPEALGRIAVDGVRAGNFYIFARPFIREQAPPLACLRSA